MGMSTDVQIQVMNDISTKRLKGIQNSFFSDSAFLTRLMKKKKVESGDRYDVVLKKGNALVGDEKDATKIQEKLTALYKKQGDIKNPDMYDILTNGYYKYSFLGTQMGITKEEEMSTENAPGQLMKLMEYKWDDYAETFRTGFGYGLFAGRYNTVSPVELVGLDKVFDNTYALAGISPTTYTIWQAGDYNFNSGDQFGYAATAVNTREKLISTSGSLTPGLPIILDIFRRCVWAHTFGQDKPTLALVDRGMWEIMNAAFESLLQGRSQDTKVKDPLLLKFDAFEYAGVVVVADDMRVNNTSITPKNTIWLLNENHVDLMFHKGDEFKMGGWKESTVQWFSKTNDISTIAQIVYHQRNKHARITMPTALVY